MKKLYALLRWPWTPWQDVCTFSYGGTSYLVQGRTSVVTNLRQFKFIRCDGSRWWQSAGTTTVNQQVLERAGMFNLATDEIKADTTIRFTP